MKRSIEFHKASLKNMRAHLEREWQRIEALKSPVVRLEAQCLVLEQQIAEAERRGVDGFDEERFMKTRKK